MNDYVINGEIAYIILRNRNKEEKGRAIIDIDDLNECLKHTWYLDSVGYARTSIGKTKVRLHKFITKTDRNTLIDHINRNRLDCRKANLRECSYELNALNKGEQKNNSSGITGVRYLVTYKPTNSGYWYARYNNKMCGVKLCKPFKNKEDAIRQRKLWEKIYGGNMANLILYSTGCPKCNVLKKKLTEKNIEYTENNDIDVMTSLGIDQVPVLSVDGKLMDFAEANKWINEREV